MDPAPSTPRGPADQPYPAVSSRPDLLVASTRPWVFDSARFSRFGERFAYVKIDGRLDFAPA